MTHRLLTPAEQQALNTFVRVMRQEEMAKVAALFKGTRSRRRIADGYQEFLSHWKEAREHMLSTLKDGALPQNTSAALFRAMIEQGEKIIDDKLQLAQVMFEVEFAAPIFRYLTSDRR